MPVPNVHACLATAPGPQVDAFRSGFEAIFPLDSLAAFFEDEIEVMLCGEAPPALRPAALMQALLLPRRPHARNAFQHV